MKAIKSLFAAFFAGTVLFSCTNEKETTVVPVLSGEYKLSINADKGVYTKALALSPDGKSLTATWEQGDLVAVCRIDPSSDNLSKILGVLAPASFGSSSTVLQGSILLDGVSQGDKLYLQYPYKYTVDGNTGDYWLDCSYLGQDGNLATVSSSYAYASCGVDITSLEGDALSTTKAEFYNRQAIVRFSLTNGGSPLEASKMRICSPGLAYNFWHDSYYSYDGGLDIVPSASPVSDFTVALRSCSPSAQPYTLYAVNPSNVYTAFTAPLQFADGTYNRGTGNLNPVGYSGYDAASEWSVIGALADYSIIWNGDLNMWTDGNGRHVAASVSLKAGDQFKFRKNQDWAYNYGGSFIGKTSVAGNGATVIALSSVDVAGIDANGHNFLVLADGTYDIYLDEGTLTVIIAPASGAGKVSTTIITPPGPDPFSGWSLIGTINGTSWDTDFDMENTEGDIWVKKGVTISASDQFKIRKDHQWDYSLGGASLSFSLPGGYDVFQPTVGTEFQADSNIGINIYIGADGVYDIRLDAAKETILITSAQAG